jgi:hypothetical protein
MNENIVSLDAIINNDPTLKFFLRDTKIDYELLDHQVNVKSIAILIAIDKFVDINIY